MRSKVTSQRPFYANRDIKLFISEGIRKIIVDEMIKLADISG
jgi:hypothetical protein